MSDDLISRSELISKYLLETFDTEADMNRVEILINNAPTVNTTCPNCDSGYAQGYSDGYLRGKEERPKGKWLDEKFVAFHLTCNQCGCHIRRQKKEVFEGDFDYNFCPNCGACMIKETNNEQNKDM